MPKVKTEKRAPDRQQERPKLTKFTCKRKGCRKKINTIALKNDDPFCSNICAREHFGNPLPKQSIWSSNHTAKGIRPEDDFPEPPD